MCIPTFSLCFFFLCRLRPPRFGGSVSDIRILFTKIIYNAPRPLLPQIHYSVTTANHNNIIPPVVYGLSARAPSFRLLLLFHPLSPIPHPAATDRIINITIIITQIYRVVIIIMTPPRGVFLQIIIQRVLVTSSGSVRGGGGGGLGGKSRG